MGRRLPWNVENDNESRNHVRSAPKFVKYVEDTNHATKSSAAVSSKLSNISSQVKKLERQKTTSRTPSTSPPPAPPEIEPMREGFDADDVYMMVEDEFQEVALSFTAHLHHAEYKRFMRNAKTARRTELPELSSQMSQETKLKLKQATLADKQKVGLRRMASLSAREDDGRTIAQDEEEEDVSDPWAGTSLAGLMTTNSQPKTSLKGLERISSSTKAAQGYGPLKSEYPNDKPSPDAIQPRNAQVDGRTARTERNLPPFSLKRIRSDDFAEMGTRDLTETMRANHSGGSTERWNHISLKKSQALAREVKARSRIDDLDDFDEDLFDRKPALEIPQAPARNESKEEAKKFKPKNSRLDEVPVFLV